MSTARLTASNTAYGTARLWLKQKRRTWQVLLVGGGTLLAVALIAPRAALGHRVPQLLVAAVAATIAAAILLRCPPLGLAGIIIGGLMLPFGIGTGTESAINLAMLLIIVLSGLGLLDLLRQKPVRLVAPRVVVALLALVAAATIAFAIGLRPMLFGASTAPMRAQIGGLEVFILSAAAFLLVGYQVPDLRWLRWLTWIFLIVGAINVAARAFWPLGYVLRGLYPTGSMGSAFWIWLIALSFSQALFNNRLHVVWRGALFGLCLAALGVGLLLQRDWLSGWVPPVVAMLVILVIGLPGWGMAVAGTALVSVTLRFKEASALVTGGDNQYSLFTREAAWRILLQIIKIEPLFGLGPANYYWYTPLFPILGYAVKFNSHNNYIDIVAQTGLVGLLCFAWCAVEIWLLGWRLRTQVPDGFARAYVYGALGGLAGMLISGLLGDWMLPFVYNVGFNGFRASVLSWLFLGGLVALQRTAAKG